MSTGKLSYKMTLLGDSGVGKTSLFKKITKENFDSKIVSTIGIDKRTLFFNINTDEGEREVEISLYDTAGQERFKSISISYFRDSKGLLVIYDVTNYETFKHVGVWLGDVIDTLGKKDDYIIILWGNKLLTSSLFGFSKLGFPIISFTLSFGPINAVESLVNFQLDLSVSSK